MRLLLLTAVTLFFTFSSFAEYFVLEKRFIKALGCEVEIAVSGSYECEGTTFRVRPLGKIEGNLSVSPYHGQFQQNSGSTYPEGVLISNRDQRQGLVIYWNKSRIPAIEIWNYEIGYICVSDHEDPAPYVISPPDTIVESDLIYDFTEQPARFPGGDSLMVAFIQQHLQYPHIAKENAIEGRVYLRFVVELDGSLTEIKAVRSPHELLSEEAMRIIRLMPKWEPAIHQNRPVRSRYVVPIKFKLD